MAALIQDLRYALRNLGRSPGFSAVAVTILGLGLGANTAIFGWVRSLVLEPLPGVERSDRILAVETLTPARTRIDSSFADYADLAVQSRAFSGLIAFQERHATLSASDGARRIYPLFVSGNYFDVLGVRAALGRTFRPDEVRIPGGLPVAVIGFGFWARHFGFDPHVVGKAVRVNDRELTIVGVAPPEFKGTINGLNFEIYIPLAANPLLGGEVGDDRSRLAGNRTNRWLDVMGRLAPGADTASARAELETVAARLAKAYPDSNRGLSFTAEPVRKASYGASGLLSPVVTALFAAVGLVLLIACSNVANLLLVRATARRREFAVRLALGATRGRLVRQLVTESVVLALAGAAVGLLVVPYVNALFNALLPTGALPADLIPALDVRVFAFGFVLALTAGVLSGLAPALQMSRPNVDRDLREGGAGSGLGRSPQRLRRGLVTAQLALALMLLAGAGLVVESLWNARRLDPGFDPTHVVIVGFDFPAALDRMHSVPFYRSLLERTAAVPGVVAASYGNHVPLWVEGGDWEEIRVDGYTPGPDENMKIDVTQTWPGYFAVMRMPIITGRDFTEHDDRNSRGVAIVNQAFASRYLKGRPAVGSRFRLWGEDVEIVGVVQTARYRSLTEAPRPFIYLPQLWILPPGTALHARIAPGASSASVVARIRDEARSIDARVATEGALLSDLTSAALVPQAVGARLLGALAGVALLISAVGVYGLMAFSVARRRREIGIRVALGARPSEVQRIVMSEAVRLTAIGLAGGLAGAVAATRLLRGLLIGVQPADPVVLAAVALTLGGSALLASWLPARRAARTDPMLALRAE
jgi:predicted permease